MSSAIEWTEETWNPVVGCAYVSDGCRGCYAARDAYGRLSGNELYAGLAEVRAPGELPRFTGEVRLVHDRLDRPLRWRRPRRVFVNSMSDLFHPDVPDDFVLEVFAVMGLAGRHTFQVLTKRPQRMAELVPRLSDAVETRMYQLATDRAGSPLTDVLARWEQHEVRCAAEAWRRFRPWPLPNVWLGTSVETQRYADLRVPHLLRAPAAVRFLSVEPMLGPVDLDRWTWGNRCPDPQCGDSTWDHECQLGEQQLHWVIAGGESGPQARPMHPDWVRAVRDQCTAAGVRFFFKQWGEWASYTHGDEVHADALGTRPEVTIDIDGCEVGDVCEIEREPSLMLRVGKSADGGVRRQLDGREWSEYPA